MQHYKIYIAANFSGRKVLHKTATKLERAGHRITSRWITEGNNRRYKNWHTRATAAALRDKADVERAELMILDTLNKTRRGGREVEFGIALQKGIPCWLVGQRRNIFHEFATKRFSSWKECVKALSHG